MGWVWFKVIGVGLVLVGDVLRVGFLGRVRVGLGLALGFGLGLG